MKPAAFDYLRAEHLDEALDVLRQDGSDARIIAGGQSLMAMLNMRLAKPRALIDIMRLQDLARIERKGNTVTISAPACRWSHWRCHGPAMCRPEAEARSADRSRMPIRARNCRWYFRLLAARCICATPKSAGALRQRISSRA
jgi:hypothetical protein